MKTKLEHDQLIEKISSDIKSFSTLKQDKKLRFFHGGTNSTRVQDDTKYRYIDITELNDVIEINFDERYALVEPNVSMGDLVNECLQKGFIPEVVPEFPGITCGGAINGAALESSSFKYGQFNDTCEEYEIILGNGDVVHASKHRNSDLFYGITGAYGSLGLLALIKIKLIPAAKYVHVTYSKFNTHGEIKEYISSKSKDEDISFIEGIIYDDNYSVGIIGRLTDYEECVSLEFSHPENPWFFEHVKDITNIFPEYEEIIPIRDYLFRYNRGAFWMGDYVFSLFHIPENIVSKFIMNPIMNTKKLYDGLHDLQIMQNYFIQDFYCPEDMVLEFLEYSKKKLGIFPIWLCPIKPAHGEQILSPHYIKTDLLIDVGIWGQTKKFLHSKYKLNRDFEEYISNHHIRKMLYAEVFFSEKNFWNIYNYELYKNIRKKYIADKAFPDVWSKVHVNKKYKSEYIKGGYKFFLETIKGRNLKA